MCGISEPLVPEEYWTDQFGTEHKAIVSFWYAPEPAMDQDDNTGKAGTSVEELALYNMLLPDAAYEIIADKGCLSSPSNGTHRPCRAI